MSAVPPPYYPETSFATQAQQPIVTAGLPGAQMDGEFANIQTTVNAVRSRLSQIQRDDGALANGIVGFEAMAPEILQFAVSNSIRLRGPWTPNTIYVFDGTKADVFIHEGSTRIVAVSYMSGDDYGILDETFTGALGTPPAVGTIIRDTFTGDGTETEFTMTSDPITTTNVHVYVDGLLKVSGTDFTISGKVVTFAAAPANASVIVTEVGVVTEVVLTTVADGSIITAKLANGSVTTAKLATDAVSTVKLLNGAVTTEKLGAAAVTTDKVENGAITEGKLANGAVSSSKIADGSVSSGKLDSGAVTTAAIATGAVATGSIADAAVATAKITDSAVTTAKINDAAVSTPKLADGAATTVKISDAGVTAAKLSGAQTGAAPVFGARAWATIDGTTAANKTGTYTQTGTVATISVTDHGLRVGHSVFCDFTSGTATDADFTVATVIDANNFTVTRAAATTSGNVTLNFVTIMAQGNISSVTKTATGDYCLNFAADMPNANYALTGSVISNNTTTGVSFVTSKGTSANVAGPIFKKTVSTFAVLTTSASGPLDHKEAYFMILG